MTVTTPTTDPWTALVPVDPAVAASAADRLAALATPPGALGQLGELAVRLAALSGSLPPPRLGRAGLVVAAGDHGVHAQGVTPWPQDVTGLLVRTCCEGRATVNALAGAVDAEVVVLDVGVASETVDHPSLRRRRIRPGTRDLALGPAMTAAERDAAVGAGWDAASELLDGGVDVLCTGDLGIGNTTASAALLTAVTGVPAAEVTGRGSGIDDATLERKRAVVAAAAARHADDHALDQLAALGGFEHAALVGVILAGAAARVPVVLDGVIAGAAAAVAAAAAPDVTGYLVAGHRSADPGADVALRHLGLDPVVQLQLRLGEGTGALLAVPLLRAAATLLRDVATLDEVLGG